VTCQQGARLVDYRWYLALLALGAIGCSDSSTAPDRLRDLMLGGEVTIRSRTYLIDSVQVDLNDRYVGYLGAEDSGRTTLTVVFAKESGGEEHARIGPGILDSARAWNRTISTFCPYTGSPDILQ